MKNKAIKVIKEKVKTIKPCPFCGKVPEFDYRVSKREMGSIGHFAKILPCCSILGCGKSELFFCNDNKPADYILWQWMACNLIDDWNRRIE